MTSIEVAGSSGFCYFIYTDSRPGPGNEDDVENQTHAGDGYHEHTHAVVGADRSVFDESLA
ncbi:hypothetical protein UNDYM_4362 [Undibacterium sp. YM2]|nr:hypothetical protein UNDYM_4362 [Undibacterium sp. YM2]